jgi:hypothetical protein
MVARRCAVFVLVCLGCGSTSKPGRASDGGRGGLDAATVLTDAGRMGEGGGPRDASASDASADAAAESGVCTYDPSISPPGGCPSDIPSACMDPAPSYSGSVAATFANRCGACHSRGGMAADHLLDTYDHVYGWRRDVLSFLGNCKMPPACAPQPTSAERHDLLMWLVCGAPDN